MVKLPPIRFQAPWARDELVSGSGGILDLGVKGARRYRGRNASGKFSGRAKIIVARGAFRGILDFGSAVR